jgi:serine O-acetyltransferase
MASDVRLKEQLPRLTDRIVAGYKAAGSIHYLGHCPLPNYEEIVGCLEDLKEILYPGYRRREGLHIGNVTTTSAIWSMACTTSSRGKSPGPCSTKTAL